MSIQTCPRCREFNRANNQICVSCGATLVVQQSDQEPQLAIEAEGTNGVITLAGERISIKRKGLVSLFTHGMEGDKKIPLSQVSSIHMKDAGRVAKGYFQIELSSGSEPGGDEFRASRDENTVSFKRSQQAAFDALKTAIESMIGSQ